MLRAADALRSIDVPPAAVLSFSAIRERSVGACDPPLDRLRAVRELRRAHRSVLARQFAKPRRHRLDGLDRPRDRERRGAHSRSRPLQHRPKVRVLVDGAACTCAFRHWHCDLGSYFGDSTTIEQQRVAALIHSLAAIAAIIIWIIHVYAAIWVRGSMRAMTQGYVTPGWAWRHHRKWVRSLVATGSRGPRPRRAGEGS